MVRLGWLAAGLFVFVLACQAPAPPTPTAVPVAPVPTTAAAPAGVLPTAAAPTAVPPSAAVSTAVPPTAAVSPTVVPPAVTAARVETLNAANAAFRSNDLKTAAGLYERVVNTPPAPGEGAAARAAIDDFAHFRALVTLLAAGQEDNARTHLEALQSRDANAPLARLSSQLWDQYGMTGQLRGACTQLQPQIATQAGPVLSTLQGIGVSVDAATLCSLPQA
jgi:hypothetical protein